jgi:hypothetical protein
MGHRPLLCAGAARSISFNRSFLTLSFGEIVAPHNHRSICARVTVWIVEGSRTATSIFVAQSLLDPPNLPEDLEGDHRSFEEGFGGDFNRVLDPLGVGEGDEAAARGHRERVAVSSFVRSTVLRWVNAHCRVR